MSTPEWFREQTLEFLKSVRVAKRPDMPEWQLADDAIREKEQEAAQKQADRLVQQTDHLTGNVAELVRIAAEQVRLAAKLDVQTDTIISLTRWLRGLTIALVVLAIPLALEALHFIKVRKDSAKGEIHVDQNNQNTQVKTNR